MSLSIYVMASQLFWHRQEHHIHNSSINYVLHLYLHYKSLLYIPLLHLFSLLFYLYVLPLYIRLNQFYLSSQSCFVLFSLALLNSFFLSLYLPSLSLSLSLLLSLPILYLSSSYRFLSSTHIDSFLLSLILLFIPFSIPPDGGRAFRGKTKLRGTWHEILAGKVMTTYLTVKSSTPFLLDPGHVDTMAVAMTIAY